MTKTLVVTEAGIILNRGTHWYFSKPIINIMPREFQKWSMMFDKNINSQAEKSTTLLRDFREKIERDADQIQQQRKQQLDQLLVLTFGVGL